MYVETGNPIKLDGKPIIQDGKVNLVPEKRQLRAKMTVFHDGTPRNIDIVVYSWSNPKLSKTFLYIDVTGEERERHTAVRVRIGYDFLKKMFKVTGVIGESEIDYSTEKFSKLVRHLKDLF